MIKMVRRRRFKKLFIDFEKEEIWLQEMCANRYALKDISKGYYIFEECEPNEYIYRIDYIGTAAKLPNPNSYLSFMKELNIEIVAESGPWVYFRRKSALGPFELYSDIDSKLKRYISVNILWNMPWFIALANVIPSVNNTLQYIKSEKVYWDMIIIYLLPILFGVPFFILSLPLNRKIIRLLKEKKIRE